MLYKNAIFKRNELLKHPVSVGVDLSFSCLQMFTSPSRNPKHSIPPPQKRERERLLPTFANVSIHYTQEHGLRQRGTKDCKRKMHTDLFLPTF